MPTTRSSSARQDAGSKQQDAAPNSKSPTKGSTGTKRASDGATSQAKRGKKGAEDKKQKTIEETLNAEDDGADEAQEKEDKAEDTQEDVRMKDEGAEEPSSAKEEATGQKEAPSESKSSAVIEDPERAEAIPSEVLEKGIIYFFFRGRVTVDEPQGVSDVARSYIVLRPLPLGAKLGEGSLEDAGNYRLLALPKKVLPVRHSDRFMVFVEKPKTTLQDLKENFLAGSDYETKTVGTRHSPEATPSGEGVYAITSRGGRDSHLSYILTVPSEINEVQQELGLRERASFVTSVKNPKAGGPPQARLPQSAEFDQELLDEFHGRAWTPLKLRFLDYENAQILLIGGDVDDITKTVEPTAKDQKQGKETPLEELEKLEHEDEIRIDHLKGDDPVLEDLGLSSKEHSKLQTTW